MTNIFSQEEIERIARSVFEQDEDNDTVSWEKQPPRIRSQTRRQVRKVLVALKITHPTMFVGD